ncbi:glycoside hydrolase family 31 protein [Atractiella rhizophila]|nr:glycoside hydrolase family 31 protein [Atractiella rhizophila]
MREILLEGFSLASDTGNGIHLANPKGYQLSLDLVHSSSSDTTTGPIFRLRLFHPVHRPLPKLIKPSPFSSSSLIEARLEWKGAPVLSIVDVESGVKVHEDLPNRSYSLTAHGIRHYSRLDRSSLYLGLGEVTAPLNLNGRSFTLRPTDAASYDSYHSDPLYKHTPFLLTVPRTRQTSIASAIYSSSKSDSSFDLGQTIDEPWGTFKILDVETGGKPMLPPRWSLGYLASSMGLAESDDPPAQELMEGFLDKLEKYNIPCSSMHLSSGYTVTKTQAGYSRNVFTLNKERFPDFSGFCAKYHQRGLRIVPNIKPYLISHHPDYDGLVKGKGLFVDPETKEQVKTMIWAAGIGETLKGSWADTSSREGWKWWYEGASKLIQMGVDGLWNDNDEYSLHDDRYEAAWDLPSLSKNEDGSTASTSTPIPVGRVGRMAFNELLGAASHQALLDNSKGRRPFILTRSASLDTMQYVCSTWSGDNYSNWKTLKGNTIMTINASISGYHSYGSDVGGFAGPLPSPELFLRWCQINAYQTRFSIHSYKPNANDPTGQATVNSPWMYPQILPLVRSVIQRRYELIPYFYALAHESTALSSPPVTPLFWPPFQQDPEALSDAVVDGADFWLGTGRILVAGAFEEGTTKREVYLPKSKDGKEESYFMLFPPYDVVPAGQRITVPTPLEHIAVFARSGTVLPIGKPCATITSEFDRKTNDGTTVEVKAGLVELDDWRGVEIFPPSGETEWYGYEWTEDDGESTWPCPVSRIRLEYRGLKETVEVKAAWKERAFETLWKTLWVVLPFGEEREVKGAKGTRTHRDGRTIYEIEVRNA